MTQGKECFVPEISSVSVPQEKWSAFNSIVCPDTEQKKHFGNVIARLNANIFTHNCLQVEEAIITATPFYGENFFPVHIKDLLSLTIY